MCATPAQVVPQSLQHLRLRRARIVHQQSLRRHDHAVKAIAALRGLLLDEGVLHRVGMIARSEAFERQNASVHASAYRDHAGAGSYTVDDHGACAAFAESAAELWAVQLKIVAQYVKQRGVGRGADIMDPAVDRQANRLLRQTHRQCPICCVAKGRQCLCATITFVYKRASA